MPFKVVVDAFMTDTARRADLFLPCTLMHEQEDVEASYLHNFVNYVKAVLDPPGEARSDYRILRDLGLRLDPPVVLPEPDDIFRAALDAPNIDFSLEELREKRFVRATGPLVAYEGLKFDHPDGKYRFPPELHEEPECEAGYPLRLLSLVRREFIHSQMLPEHQSMPPTIWIAPDAPDAGRFAVGEMVALASPLGRIEVRLEFMPGLHPEVVVYRRGDWMALGGGANRIIAGGLTDAGKGAPFYKQCVRIERV
jgi:anaerobic selenocysteine-containing dehydrogenase